MPPECNIQTGGRPTARDVCLHGGGCTTAIPAQMRINAPINTWRNTLWPFRRRCTFRGYGVISVVPQLIVLVDFFGTNKIVNGLRCHPVPSCELVVRWCLYGVYGVCFSLLGKKWGIRLKFLNRFNICAIMNIFDFIINKYKYTFVQTTL